MVLCGKPPSTHRGVLGELGLSSRAAGAVGCGVSQRALGRQKELSSPPALPKPGAALVRVGRRVGEAVVGVGLQARGLTACF